MQTYRSRFLQFLAYMLLGLSTLTADDGRVRFSALTMMDGLANSSVSSIVQDSKGFLWIGTQAGLHRYDGSVFTVYQNEPFDATSLPHNLIQTMFMDPDGHTLWLGTYGGLARLDTRTDQFSSWVFRADDPESLRHDIVISIARDAKGRLWVGTMEGLCRLDEASGRFFRYTATGETDKILGNGVIRSMLLDSRGDFWIGTSGGGVFRLEPADDSFVNYAASADPKTGLPGPYVMSIAEDPTGKLWFGCWFYGMACFDPATKLWTPYPLEDNRVYFVNAQDPDYVYAGIWGGGLYSLEVATGRLDRYRREGSSSSHLSHDTLYSMFIDANRNKWLGTNGGGLNRMSRLPEGLILYEHDPAVPGSRSAGRTSAILKDSKGRLWVGTHNSGLNMLPAGSETFVKFRHDPANPRSISNDIITGVYEDSQGTIWVLSNIGISRYLEDSGGFSTITNDPNRPDSLPDNIVYDILEEPKTGNFWVGTYTHGLAYWDRRSDSFRRFPADPDDSGSLSNNLVNKLAYDAQGRLWVGTNDGLNRYNGDGTFTRYFSDPANYRGLPSKIARNLKVDSRGNLWIATNGGGLSLYIESNDTFRTWTRRDGLPSNVVYAIQEDRNGNIWISTTAGLAILDVKTGLIRPYVAFSDLRYKEFSVGSSSDREGYLYFGASNALYRLDPEQDAVASLPERLRFTAIDFERQESAYVAPWYTESVWLPWDKNHVSFNFSILDYRESQGNQYAYMLSGFDEDWIYSGSRNFASYTNLPGGRYTFKVRAANNDGMWTEQDMALPLVVQSPPWLRWWAFILYAAGLALLMLAVASLRSRMVLATRVAELSLLKDNLEKANARLFELSSHDDLTGLWNRRYFDAEITRLLEQAAKERNPVSLLMVDVDHFRAYNERYGYAEGDQCLKRIAACVRDVGSSLTGLTARYASEEMVLFLYGISGDEARKLAERVRLAVFGLELFNEEASEGRVTVSIGVCSLLPDGTKDMRRLVDGAESALYRAKHEGRNTVELKLS